MPPIEIVILIGICLVFVLFILIPGQKKNKKEKIFLQNIQVGDKIITTGGIHGIVLDINEECVVLQMEDGHSRILLSKKFIEIEETMTIYPKHQPENTETKKSKKK